MSEHSYTIYTPIITNGNSRFFLTEKMEHKTRLVVYSLSVQHLPNHFLSYYVQILLILHQYSSMHHKRFVLLLKKGIMTSLLSFTVISACHVIEAFPFLYTFKALTNLSRFSSVAFHIWNNTVSEMPFA